MGASCKLILQKIIQKGPAATALLFIQKPPFQEELRQEDRSTIMEEVEELQERTKPSLLYREKG